MADFSVIQPTFTGGEIAPLLQGRVDLAKYRTAAAVMRNIIPDFRGGALNLAGSQIVGPCRQIAGDPPPRVISFRFNDDQAYVLELSGSTMRVIEDGQYQTEAAVAITGVTQTAPPVVTAPGHGLEYGDYCVIDGVVGMLRPNGISGLNGRMFRVALIAGDTVTLGDPWGFPIPGDTWTAWASGGTIAKAREVETPWPAAILFELKFVQSADVMTVVHATVPAYNIERLPDGSWQVVPEGYGPTIDPPASVTAVATDTQTDQVQYKFTYTVTAVDSDTNDESAPADPDTVATTPLFPNDIEISNIIKITYPAATDADLYRIYKAQVVPDSIAVLSPPTWGLIGETASLEYADLNYAPDFTRAPPQYANPFNDGTIESVTILTPGWGYTGGAAVVLDETGGAVIAVGADAPDGAIVTMTVINGGSGYVTPELSLTIPGFTPGTTGAISFGGTWVDNGSGIFIPDVGDFTITNPGSGYHAPVATLEPATCAGSGPFVTGRVYLQVPASGVNAGQITGIYFDIAKGYEPPSVGTDSTSCTLVISITDYIPGTDTTDSPSGATFQVNLGEQLNPGCVTYFQQRKVFAGGAAPRSFFMSRPGLFTNFSSTYPPVAGDAISGVIVGPDVNEILSLVPMATGCVALTGSAAYLISGGSPTEAVSPFNITAQQQFSSGAAALQPVVIGPDILFLQARGSAVRSLTYDFYVDSYNGIDISALSSHLLEGPRIVQWAWAEEPLRTVWSVREDGIMLSLVYIKDQQVYGWSRHDTAGRFVSVTSIPEGDQDAVYVVTRRIINGQFFYLTERMASRYLGGNPGANMPTSPELAWFVDSGARYPLTYPDAALLPGATSPVGQIADPDIITGGSGYPSSPVVEVIDPTGTGAEVTVTVGGGIVTGVTIVNAGAGYTNPSLQISGGAGAVVAFSCVSLQDFEADAAITASVGDVVRVGGGQGIVTAVPDSTHFTADMTMPILAFVPNEPNGTLPPILAEAGDWSLTTPVSVVGGLDHLTGKIVTGVADGSVVTPRLVVDGCVELDAPATAVTLGLGYTSQLQTLKMDLGDPTVQGKRKKITAITIRATDNRGLAVGPDFEHLTEVKERRNENFGQPIVLQLGGGQNEPLYEDAPSAEVPVHYRDTRTILPPVWTEDGQVAVQQSYPLPMSILDIIPEVMMGDR